MKEKKEVLIISQYFYPEYVTSATLATELACDLVEENIKVDVLAGYPKDYINEKVTKKEEYKNINIKRVKYLSPDRNNFFGKLINFFSFFLAILLNIFTFRKYEVIISFSNPPIIPIISVIASRFFNIKTIFVSYDVYPEMAISSGTTSSSGLISRIMVFINKNVFRTTDIIIALSNDMKNFFLENRSVDEDRIKVIPNWYEKKEIAEPMVINKSIEKFTEDSLLTVSYFGNMGICQNMDTLMKSIEVLKNDTEIKFMIAGHGSKFKSIENEIKTNNYDNVLFMDFLHGEDFLYALESSDMCIVSLEDFATGLAVPSKTYSYMMAGKGLIAIMNEKTDIYQEVIQEKTGISINNDDVSALVNSLILLKNDKELVEKYGNNAKRVFLEKYERKVVTKKYGKIVKELL